MFIHIHDPVNFSRSRDGEFKKNTTYQTLVHVSSLRYKKGSQGGEKRTEMSGAAGRFIISIPYIISSPLDWFSSERIFVFIIFMLSESTIHMKPASLFDEFMKKDKAAN